MIYMIKKFKTFIKKIREIVLAEEIKIQTVISPDILEDTEKTAEIMENLIG
jgi:hypothetical protein